MTTFTIDSDNNITVFAEAPASADQGEAFWSEKELGKLTADWPASRLVETWNSFAGAAPFDDLKPVKKFTDRKAAVARIWKAIQRLTPAPAPQATPVAPKKAGSKKSAANGEERATKGRHRRARRQQESQSARTTSPARRSYPHGHYGGNRVAGPQRSRVH